MKPKTAKHKREVKLWMELTRKHGFALVNSKPKSTMYFDRKTKRMGVAYEIKMVLPPESALYQAMAELHKPRPITAKERKDVRLRKG